MFDDTIGVVIDAGSQNTKAGFAGEVSPRVMFPTTVARFRHEGLIDGLPLIYSGNEAVQKRGICNLVWPVQNGLIKNWDEMEKLWHHVFYKELHVPPENTRVLYSLHPLVPRQDKEKMAEILFESFTIHGLYMGKSPALVLHATGRTSGIVWENGHESSYVAPVFEGFLLKHSTLSYPVTGKVLTERLQKLLFDLGYSFTTPLEFDLMDQIKKDICYVALNYEKEQASMANQDESKVKYMLPDGQHVMLREERFQMAEAFFQPGLVQSQGRNLLDTITASIDLCDLDYRKMFTKNIVFSGGSSLFPGIVERVSQDLSLQLRTEARPHIEAMPMRQHLAWAGGAMIASIQGLKGFWLTKEEYDDAGASHVKYKFL